MTVVIDTNVVVQMFGSQSPYGKLKQALMAGKIRLVVSTPIFWSTRKSLYGTPTRRGGRMSPVF